MTVPDGAPRHPRPFGEPVPDVTDARDSREGHTCFGCQKQIADGEPHIHVGLDEFAAKSGGGLLGLDDLLTFAFCEPCTVRAKDGWHLEAHDVAELPERSA
jgi:hypothetical protein